MKIIPIKIDEKKYEKEHKNFEHYHGVPKIYKVSNYPIKMIISEGCYPFGFWKFQYKDKEYGNRIRFPLGTTKEAMAKRLCSDYKETRGKITI